MESSSVQKTSISPNEDLRSPYFLYHTNHHGLVVINPKLTSSNYVTWSRSFMLALSIKYKVSFIDGTIHKPKSTNALFGP